MIVELYISLNGSDYVKLDLMQSESILIKYIYKDTQELSKIYSPYSQSFALQGSLHNQKALGFIGETKVLKSKTNNNFDCKIYNNGLLAKKGILKITEVKYERGKIKSFISNFTTSFLSLKDRIGEDKVSDLGSAFINWDSLNVKDYIQEGINYFGDVYNNINAFQFIVPLVSKNRIWQWADINNSSFLDNIAYNPNADKNGENFVRFNELNPALQFRRIIDRIKSKYDLNIIMPLEQEYFYNDLYVHCNAQQKNTPISIYYNVINPFRTSDSDFFRITAVTNTFFRIRKKILTPPAPGSLGFYMRYNDCYLEVSFYNFFGLNESEAKIDITIEKPNGDIFTTQSITVKNGESKTTEKIRINGYTDFDNNNDFYFFIKITTNSTVKWTSSQVVLRYYLSFYYYNKWREKDLEVVRISDNNNSYLMNFSKIDLFKSLPEMKIVDFLESFFKTFNISIFETSPNDGRLYWLTPEDIKKQNKEYSKKEVDYTDYVVSDVVNKKIANDYNYYNFKHKTSKYFSSFEEITGKQFGQLNYPLIKPTKDLREFKIETNFSILERVELNGFSNVKNSYGFTNEITGRNSKGANRYKPNTEDFTIFFYNTNELEVNNRVAKYIGYLQENPSGTKSISPILGHPKIGSIHDFSKFSLGFGLIEEATNESLYENYYKEQTERLLDANSLQSTFTLELPSNELVLNYANATQGQSNIPSGFRLQNDIVIGETRYSIIDATIDQTTGKTTLNLLNYV